jgi:LysM repeat protein
MREDIKADKDAAKKKIEARRKVKDMEKLKAKREKEKQAIERQKEKLKRLLKRDTPKATIKNIKDKIKKETEVLGRDMKSDKKRISEQLEDSPPTKKADKYKIKSGDTLSKIARDRGVTVAQIMAANTNIKDKNKIFAGQSINIPTAKVRAISKSPDTPTRKPTIVTLKSGKKGTAAERLAEIDAEKNKKKLISSQRKIAGLFSEGGGAGLKPIPAGNKGKGLSMLDKSVRNKMGFMYGGGMPIPSKKPRMSNTDYRKASKGMLIISIDMMKKKKGKGKGKKKS